MYFNQSYALGLPTWTDKNARACVTCSRRGKRYVYLSTYQEASSKIKLEDQAKLVSNVQPSFKDLDSPEDDPVIVVDDSDEDEEDEIHTTTNDETKDTSVPKSLSPKSSQIQDLTNQVLILRSQKHKLELEKNIAEAKASLFNAQPSFPNVGKLNKLLEKYLQTEFLKILYAHDFSNSLPTKLKDIPSKFNKLTKEVEGLKNQVHEFKIKLPGDLKEIPTNLENFTKNGRHIHLTEEEYNHQKKLEEDAKAKAAKQEDEVRKAELVDLLGPEVKMETFVSLLKAMKIRRISASSAQEMRNDQFPIWHITLHNTPKLTLDAVSTSFYTPYLGQQKQPRSSTIPNSIEDIV
uniref:Uncharacterized protein n=1 Tax=Tanacetum cinerariifolium TaxID=118510 RepID=A0A6L2N156_TANCI|nr:hypothetical protein [Tanacetum cinerariifolium]